MVIPPTGIGCSIPMVPLGSAAFPAVAISGLVGVDAMSGLIPAVDAAIGVRPVMGVSGESPGDDMERGVIIAKFVPPIMGTEPIPETNDQHFGSDSSNNWCKNYFAKIK